MPKAKDGIGRDNLGFLLAKAAQHWNERLQKSFEAAGFGHVRPSYGSILVPLFEEDGLRLGELARRSKLSKQTMTTMVRLVERDGLVERRPDEEDARAVRVYLTRQAERFRPVASATLRKLEAEAAAMCKPAELNTVREWLKRFADL